MRNADNLCVDIEFHKDLFEFFDFFRKVFRNDVRMTFVEKVDGRRVIRFLLLFQKNALVKRDLSVVLFSRG